MNAARRLALATVLVVATVGLCVVADATSEQRSADPTAEQVATDYESVAGERTLLTGSVRAVDADAVTLHVSADPPLALTATGVDATVEPGGVLQVYGRLEPDGTIAAERTVVVSRSGDDELYKWLVSAVGAALFLALFAREWRVNLRALQVEVRGDG